MNYGQNFRFGFFEIEAEKRMRAIKESGFNRIMMWWGDDFKNTDGDKFELVKLAFKYDLKFSALHASAINSSHIWINDNRRDIKINEYIKVLEQCNQIECPSMVIHLTHKHILYPASEIGLASIEKLLKAAEKQGVNLAIENTRFLDYNDYIYKNLSSPRLKCCFDTGHNHCYTPNNDVFEKYHDKIVVTHLHDNYGTNEIDELSDRHYLIGDGTINWLEIRKKLLTLNLDTINLESYCRPMSKYYGMSLEEYLKLSYLTVTNLMEKAII